MAKKAQPTARQHRRDIDTNALISLNMPSVGYLAEVFTPDRCYHVIKFNWQSRRRFDMVCYIINLNQLCSLLITITRQKLMGAARPVNMISITNQRTDMFYPTPGKIRPLSAWLACKLLLGTMAEVPTDAEFLRNLGHCLGLACGPTGKR